LVNKKGGKCAAFFALWTLLNSDELLKKLPTYQHLKTRYADGREADRVKASSG